jgi:single-strand DNA-binding protein
MSGSLNRVTLIGNLGADPEVRTTADGRRIVRFSVATTERWKDGSGARQERTDWHRVAIFSPGLGKLAEDYLRKGSKVLVEGQLRTSKWQDQTGQDRYTTEVVLMPYTGLLMFLDSRRAGSEASEERSD